MPRNFRLCLHPSPPAHAEEHLAFCPPLAFNLSFPFSRVFAFPIHNAAAALFSLPPRFPPSATPALSTPMLAFPFTLPECRGDSLLPIPNAAALSAQQFPSPSAVPQRSPPVGFRCAPPFGAMPRGSQLLVSPAPLTQRHFPSILVAASAHPFCLQAFACLSLGRQNPLVRTALPFHA